jgi:hypothetical protein
MARMRALALEVWEIPALGAKAGAAVEEFGLCRWVL